MTGLSVRTIQRIEGGTKPGFETAKALAATFDVDVQSLLGETDDGTAGTEGAGQGPSPDAAYRGDLHRLVAHACAYVLITVLLSMASVTDLLQGRWIPYTLFGWGLGLVAHGCYAGLVVVLARRSGRRSSDATA